jgi:hypothetical protein
VALCGTIFLMALLMPASARGLRRDDKDSAGKDAAKKDATNKDNHDLSAAISAAVEEQTATTGEIARNISEGAKVSTEIARNISGVAHAVQSTSSGAHELRTAVSELERMSSELRTLVGQFKYERAKPTEIAPPRAKKVDFGWTPAPQSSNASL